MFKKSGHVWRALMPLAALVSVGAHASGLDSFSGLSDPASINAPVYAGVTLGNLNVTLIDLDLNDGVTPGITYHVAPLQAGNEPVGGLLTSGGADAGQFNSTKVSGVVKASGEGSSPWMPSQTTLVTSLDGVTISAAGPDDLMSATRLTSQDLWQQRVIKPSQTYKTVADGYGELGNLGDRVAPGIPLLEGSTSYFEVTPQTQVVFSGTGVGLARASGALDPSITLLTAHAFASAAVARYAPIAANADWSQFEL